MNENCCLCNCFTELYFFYWLLVVSLAIFIAVPFVFSRSWTSLAGINSKCRACQTLFKSTHRYKTLELKKINRINSLLCWSVIAKSSRLIFLSEYWLGANCLEKLWNTALSEVCMINSTVSPQMWCIKSIKGWFTHPQVCWQDFVK